MMPAQCELIVVVSSQAERSALLEALVFAKELAGVKRGGRMVKHAIAVGGIQLQPGDRLEPSPTLTDVTFLDSRPLPVTIIFWRTHRDGRGRCLDMVHHRYPIFNDDIGMDPARVLAVDGLHTVYYGPVMKWSSAVIWRVLLSNPWDISAAESTVLDLGVKKLRSHQIGWYETEGIPHDRRIGDLTVVMLGDKRGCTVRGSHPHPGTTMKTKAAETGILFEWSLSLLKSELGARVQHSDDLLKSGRALQQWLEITRTQAFCLSMSECQRLCDCAQRHLLHSRFAGIAMVPKHHFFSHLWLPAYFQGNPKVYSCFIDESLNLILRELAANTHRARHAERIFTHLRLIGALRPVLMIAD